MWEWQNNHDTAFAGFFWDAVENQLIPIFSQTHLGIILFVIATILLIFAVFKFIKKG